MADGRTQFDTVIRGGTVIDGTGTVGSRADVAIRGLDVYADRGEAIAADGYRGLRFAQEPQ